MYICALILKFNIMSNSRIFRGQINNDAPFQLPVDQISMFVRFSLTCGGVFESVTTKEEYYSILKEIETKGNSTFIGYEGDKFSILSM